ncbi:Pre-splicing factor CWC22 [Sesamum alatum]|uniref:Pre-splicing factor CWC22 n=1 Tax=Sesamum alatum TaxID=300844 RepID=A0AAE1XM34_9LAMI|nr:Pre-splicing factor CWC22 [Sesamum alatum]
MDSLNSAVTFSDSCTPNKHHRQSIERQRSTWLSMEKTITGLVKKLNLSNVQLIASEILNQDLISGRGLFCRAVMKSQVVCPQLSNVYAALVAIINSEFPDVGLLLVKRVVLQFKETYDQRRDKKEMAAALKFLAQLVNQAVVYELVAFDVLLLLLGRPSSDHVEVAVRFCVECGSSLLEFSPRRLNEVVKEFRRVRGEVEEHVQVLILRLFVVRRLRFKEHRRVIDELDFVEVEDQVTHEVSLLHEICWESSVDSFKAESESFEHEMCSEIVIPCDDYDYDDDEVTSGTLRGWGRETLRAGDGWVRPHNVGLLEVGAVEVAVAVVWRSERKKTMKIGIRE